MIKGNAWMDSDRMGAYLCERGWLEAQGATRSTYNPSQVNSIQLRQGDAEEANGAKRSFILSFKYVSKCGRGKRLRVSAT